MKNNIKVEPFGTNNSKQWWGILNGWLTTAHDCPSFKNGSCKVRKYCYAFSQEKNHKNVFEFEMECVSSFHSMSSDDIVRNINGITIIYPFIKYIRWNEAGDIPSEEVCSKLLDIARKTQGIITHVFYTCNLEVLHWDSWWELKDMQNVVMNVSRDELYVENTNRYKVVSAERFVHAPYEQMCKSALLKQHHICGNECKRCYTKHNGVTYTPLRKSSNNPIIPFRNILKDRGIAFNLYNKAPIKVKDWKNPFNNRQKMNGEYVFPMNKKLSIKIIDIYSNVKEALSKCSMKLSDKDADRIICTSDSIDGKFEELLKHLII